MRAALELLVLSIRSQTIGYQLALDRHVEVPGAGGPPLQLATSVFDLQEIRRSVQRKTSRK